MEQPKRRIVKETTLYGINDASIYTRPRERFVVEVKVLGGNTIYAKNGDVICADYIWETEVIPMGNNFQPYTPAIFGTYEEAFKYVNGEYGETGREVVWESE